MKYLVTAAEMKEYDSNTINRIGIPAMVLMERAALAAWEAVERYTKMSGCSKKVLVLAGMGNNGGDGLALARLLSEKAYDVDVWCVGDQSKASEQWTAQYNILKNYPVRIGSKALREEYTILVDALFGIGLSREVTGEYAAAIQSFNKLKGYKIALDIPSGIEADRGSVLGTAIGADLTVTFGFGKRGLFFYPGADFAGQVETADIGIGEQSFLNKKPEMFYLDEEASKLLPARDKAGNKGTFGKVLLIAGSVNMAGAALLAAQAAYRAGAGMVKVLTVPENRVILQSRVPEALIGTGEDLVADKAGTIQWADVIAIGPGIGRTTESAALLEQVIMECNLPLVLDADALNILSERAYLQNKLAEQAHAGRPVIMTPHPGELSRLCGQSIKMLKERFVENSKILSEKLHAVVVAKDVRTLICKEAYPVCMNIHGNNGMATAGSGDVLTGLIAGLLAQQMDSFEAACAGVNLHGIAGDKAAAEHGEHGCMAEDIVNALGVWKVQ